MQRKDKWDPQLRDGCALYVSEIFILVLLWDIYIFFFLFKSNKNVILRTISLLLLIISRSLIKTTKKLIFHTDAFLCNIIVTESCEASTIVTTWGVDTLMVAKCLIQMTFVDIYITNKFVL